MVTIGVDPHKQTHTTAAVNPLGAELGGGELVVIRRRRLGAGLAS
jgi:hypothetical protein